MARFEGVHLVERLNTIAASTASADGAAAVNLLGALTLAQGGTAVALGSLGRRERAVLALLAVHAGRPVSLDRIVDELWPEEPPPRATNTVQVYVSRLRRLLGATTIMRGSAGYALRGPSVDLERFWELVQVGTRHFGDGRTAQAYEALSGALALWRGAPFADCAELPSLAAERVRLEEARLRAVEDSFECELEEGRGAELIPQIRAALRESALRERMVGQLMRALAQAGRTSEALALFENYRKESVDQLGIEPGPGLRDVHVRVLRGEERPGRTDHRAVPLPVTRPPSPATPLLGRDTEVKEVLHQLRDPGTRLVTILGPGGVGKTRLMLEVASWLTSEGDFEDGVVWVPLAAVPDPSSVPAAMAKALGLRGSETASPVDFVFDQLARRDLLMVLDNIEHLLPHTSRVIADLLLAGPHVRLAATSRTALRIDGEHRYPLGPLSMPPAGSHADAVVSTGAGALFWERAKAVDPQLALTDEEATGVTEICRNLDGLPLALELAAARINVLSLPQLAAQVSGGGTLSVLTGQPGATLHERSSLRDTIRWSVDLLPPTRRRLLARLSVFDDGFTLDAAEAVGNHDQALGDSVLDGLGDLADASLLVQRTSGRWTRNDRRWDMLATIRSFATELLAEDHADAHVCRAALTTWATEQTQDIAQLVPPLPITRAQMLRLADEHVNIRNAILFSRARNDRRTTAALVLVRSGWHSDPANEAAQRTWLEELVADPPDRRTEVAARAMLPHFLTTPEHPTVWVRQLREALTRAYALPDWETALRAELAMALADTADVDPDEVRALSREAVSGARALGRPDLLLHVLSIAGGALSQADPPLSVELLSEAVAISGGTGLMGAIAASNLAEALLVCGEPLRAARAAERGIAGDLEVVSALHAAHALDNLAAARLAIEDPDAAEGPLREAMARADWFGDRALLAETLCRATVLAAQRADVGRVQRLMAAADHILVAENLPYSGSTQVLFDRFVHPLLDGAEPPPPNTLDALEMLELDPVRLAFDAAV